MERNEPYDTGKPIRYTPTEREWCWYLRSLQWHGLDVPDWATEPGRVADYLGSMVDAIETERQVMEEG